MSSNTADIMGSMSTTDILSLYARYRSGEKVQGLIDEHSLPVIPSKFNKIFTEVKINNLLCPLCASRMHTSLPAKAIKLDELLIYTCQGCEHRVEATFEGIILVNAREVVCSCSACLQKLEISTLSFMDKVKAAFKNHSSVDINSLGDAGLSEIVGMIALLRTWSTEDMSYIQPRGALPNLLCPTEEMSRQLFTDMYRRGLVIVDTEHSPKEGFAESTVKKGEYVFYSFETALQPSLYESQPEFTKDIPGALAILTEYLKAQLSDEQKAEIPELMLKIAINECTQFYQYMMEDHGFDTEVGEKTEQLFEELLDRLSVGHVLPCIWSAIKGAAAFTQSPSCKGRQHAYNTILGKIRDTAYRRISGEVQSAPFDRNHHLPRAEISIELYTAMGYDGDIGFDSALGNIKLPEEWEVTPEYARGGIFTDYEQMMLNEANYCEITESLWERPLPTLGRIMYVRKLHQAPNYEIEVFIQAQIQGDDHILAGKAKMIDFTSVVVFTDALLKNDDYEYEKKQKQIEAEGRDG